MANLCSRIQYTLKRNGFYVCKTRPVQFGTQFHLGVGPIITVYNTGKVLVQGKFKPHCTYTRNFLKSMLPATTRWMA